MPDAVRDAGQAGLQLRPLVEVFDQLLRLPVPGSVAHSRDHAGTVRIRQVSCRKPTRSASRAEVAHGPAEERAALPGDVDGLVLSQKDRDRLERGRRESGSRRADRQRRQRSRRGKSSSGTMNFGGVPSSFQLSSLFGSRFYVYRRMRRRSFLNYKRVTGAHCSSGGSAAGFAGGRGGLAGDDAEAGFVEGLPVLRRRRALRRNKRPRSLGAP